MLNIVSKISSRVVRSSLVLTTTRSFATASPVFKEAKASSSSVPKDTKKKGKKKKSQKELDKPRRPMSAFSLYYKEMRTELGKVDTAPTAAMKQIAEKWREESEEVKEKYSELKEEAKEEYDKKLAEWKAKYPPKLSGYNKFVKANFNKASVTSAAELPAESKRIAALWGKLSPEQKKEWSNK
ncbi:DEKNAAC104558 [Brettanomyces naardenensis]|uniref:DEKNAAC104558 n=1 Tax=Brettanomyces naardenensis TaxID=13370 RepID=A0A448YRJ8_BRENA|nr:DEKNAAC104558 [Brettanomyces naardenensis]